MCAITGWVAFPPEPRQRPELLRTMLDTLACRGPDASGLWLDLHAALGQRRLAVIGPESGRRPMRARTDDGQHEIVLAYSGEIYNYRELRAELTAKGRVFTTRSDTEVVLQAYLVWGEESVERLEGMFAYAVWDGSRDVLVLARDRLGIKPLYYAPTPDGLVFGSEIKALLAHPDVDAAIDAEGLAELFSFVKTPGRACYRGIHEVRPGHTLCAREGRDPVSRRYWELPARKHQDDLPATIKHVRELLTDVVERQLVSDVPPCTLLSGGLDSSAITALAAHAFQRRHRAPVRSYAVDFAEGRSGIEADADSPRGSLDTPFAHLVARHARTRHSDVLLDANQLYDTETIDRVVRARDLPAGLGDGDTSLLLLGTAIRGQRNTVVLCGEGADEVFGGHRWLFDQDAVRADTFPWLGDSPVASGADPAGTPLTYLDPGLLAKIDLRGYVAEQYREAIAQVPRLAGESPAERRMRELAHLQLTRYLPSRLDRTDRIGMAAGLEVRLPFCDHRIVEYVFNVPWSLKTFDGHEKSLLRAAMRDLLPTEVLERRKSPYPVAKDPAFAEGVRRRARAVLADPDSPVLALLDGTATRRAVESASGAQVRTAGELVLLLDSWLRQYPVQIEV